jgi:hypothetical protein
MIIVGTPDDGVKKYNLASGSALTTWPILMGLLENSGVAYRVRKICHYTYIELLESGTILFVGVYSK